MVIAKFPLKVFSCIVNNIIYQIKAEPIVYSKSSTKDFQSGNWNLKIMSPKGEIKTSFYPEDGDLFDVDLPNELQQAIIHNLL